MSDERNDGSILLAPQHLLLPRSRMMSLRVEKLPWKLPHQNFVYSFVEKENKQSFYHRVREKEVIIVGTLLSSEDSHKNNKTRG